MVIGAKRLSFIVPPDGKSTRSVAHKIKDHLWRKFRISVAELSSPSTGTGELMIAVALVGNEEKDVRHRTEEVVRHLRDWSAVELVHDESELIHFEDLEIERDFEKYNP